MCGEDTHWKTKSGYKCADYAKNRWCENGTKGSAWQDSWKWAQDSSGLDARSVCCNCENNLYHRYVQNDFSSIPKIFLDLMRFIIMTIFKYFVFKTFYLLYIYNMK